MAEKLFPKKIPSCGKVVLIRFLDVERQYFLHLETSISGRSVRSKGTGACLVSLVSNTLIDGTTLEKVFYDASGWTGKHKGKDVELTVSVVS